MEVTSALKIYLVADNVKLTLALNLKGVGSWLSTTLIRAQLSLSVRREINNFSVSNSEAGVI